jgi:hypothetical protein
MDASPAGFGPYIGRSFPAVHPGETRDSRLFGSLLERAGAGFRPRFEFQFGQFLARAIDFADQVTRSEVGAMRRTDRGIAARQHVNEHSARAPAWL